RRTWGSRGRGGSPRCSRHQIATACCAKPRSVSSERSRPSIEVSFRRAQTTSIGAKPASSSQSAGRTTLVTSDPRLPFDEEEVREEQASRVERPPADHDAHAYANTPVK